MTTTDENTVTVHLNHNTREDLLDRHATYISACEALAKASADMTTDTPPSVELYQARDDAALALLEWLEDDVFDTSSSAARQHYIDTGQYLLMGEALSLGSEADVNAEAVLDECAAEATRNLENSDTHTEADIAADIVERLIRVHGLRGFNRDDELTPI